MKTARLDQILLSLGYIDDGQLETALARQKSHGGRLGLHLVQLGFVSEEQLVDALSEQFNVPAVHPLATDVPGHLVKQMPPGAVVDHHMMPLEYDADRRVLTLAVADPGDSEMIDAVRGAFDAVEVRVRIAPESLLRKISEELYEPSARVGQPSFVELPELFEADTGHGPGETAPAAADVPARILMVTRGAPRKNFLPSVFRREGRDLWVASDREEFEKAHKEGAFEAVLVDTEMVDEYTAWMRDGRLPSQDAEVTVFASVSGALLDNPVPYDRVAGSMTAALQIVADERCRRHGLTPAYALIVRDVQALARRYSLRRLATDGMAAAVQLLLPASSEKEKPFTDFAGSLDHARRLNFPWKVEALLAAVHGRYTGAPGSDGDTVGPEVALAAQIVALVWYRHNHIAPSDGHNELDPVKKALRNVGGRLATVETVEVYLRMLSEQGDTHTPRTRQQVLVVGGDSGFSKRLLSCLNRAGCRTVWTDDLTDAQRMVDRQPPAAIVVACDSFGDEFRKFGQVASLNQDVILYAATESKDPATTLDLLDLGIEDVFGPPHDFDVMAARVSRAVRARPNAEARRQGHFSAAFDAFAFTDLVQTLGQSRKSVRIDLKNSRGDTAVLYLEQGHPVHARCGDAAGEDAVYSVIAWESDGEFTVEPVSEFPEKNLSEALESILMEGCRLLDESRV